jgi:hypothetical protein
MRRCNLKDASHATEDKLEYYTVKETNSKINLWRVNTVALLHVLNASEAATTAWSNSSLVVSGTRVRSVCVDCYDVFLSQNKRRLNYTTDWVHYVNPLTCPALHKLPAYEILSVLPRGTCSLPVPREFFGFLAYD